MISVLDFLDACGVRINRQSYKIHLATNPNPANSPLLAFFDNSFKGWQEVQTQKNFSREHILSLISIGGDKWLFAGVWRVHGVTDTKNNSDRFVYDTSLLPEQSDLVGRVIVRHRRTGRASYLNGEAEENRFILSHIIEHRMSFAPFPGYNAVRIDHKSLLHVISNNLESWRGALENVKGVYVISDTETGKLYVGSATGNEGIWSRWSAYAFNGHGGNAQLRKLLQDAGPERALKFQYSILEIADTHTSDQQIVEREQYWKEVLLSRPFGYNIN